MLRKFLSSIVTEKPVNGMIRYGKKLMVEIEQTQELKEGSILRDHHNRQPGYGPAEDLNKNLALTGRQPRFCFYFICFCFCVFVFEPDKCGEVRGGLVARRTCFHSFLFVINRITCFWELVRFVLQVSIAFVHTQSPFGRK
ncbi:hypothetical protein HanRHA438_Chr17g0839141 [Helianthus annuus]|nr:hypothetical protein HanRHA438_Chr17g0839141 [Helianthus annuus]